MCSKGWPFSGVDLQGFVALHFEDVRTTEGSPGGGETIDHATTMASG